MTRWQDRAYRLRRWILGVGIMLIAAGLLVLFPIEYFALSAGYVGTPLTVLGLDVLDDPWNIYANNAIVIGIMLLLQWLMLRPGRGWTVRMLQTGRPLKISIIVAAFMSMLLTTGLIATLLEIPDWWALEWGPGGLNFSYIWTGMAFVWLIWAVVFFIYWRQGDRYTQLGRMTRALIVGSVMEIIIAAPIQVWATRQRDCYCARGSYTGLIFGTTVLLWAFGPGLVLLFMREHYRRRKLLLQVCIRCDYDLRGSIPAGSTTCPECGEPISARLIKGGGENRGPIDV